MVLFMGQPWKKDSTFGTNNHAPGAPFVSIAANEKLARSFAAAYTHCLPNALKDRGWKINLVLSQNNYGGKPGSGRANYVDYASGAAWGAMVQRVGQWIRANGHARYVRVSGGMDFESSYGSASRGRDWVNGFTSATNYPMFNTGSLNGCPPRGPCDDGWTLSDYYYVSAGADRNVFPLPQIYVRDLARQWANLSRWGVANGNRGRLRFLGPLSQHINDRRTYDASHAWSALFQEINKSTSTSQTSMPSTTFLRGSAEKTRW